MLACPNKNTQEWKDLVEIIGEREAYREYIRYGDTPKVTEVLDRAIPSEQEQKQDIGNTAVRMMADQIANNLGVPYEVIDAYSARQLTEKAKNPWNGENAFFFGGKVYLLEKGFTSDNVLHEFSHPLIAAIAVQNPTLFNKLYDEFIGTAEGDAVKSDVERLYTELEPADLEFKKEVLVRALSKEAQSTKEETPLTTSFKDFINKLLFAVKQMLRKVFGTSVKVEKLSKNTTLAQLADMLQGDKFSLDTSIISSEDFVDYIRDISNFTDELNKVEYSSISTSVNRFYDVVTNHISRIRENKNYTEARKFLVDETGRGQLQALRDTLSHSELDEKLKDLYDELTVEKKTTQALVHGIHRLDKMTADILTHIKELAHQDDSKEVITDIFYYDLLMRNWKDLINETIDRLADAGLGPNTEFSKLISGVKYNIDQTTRAINKIYAGSVDEVLYNSLKPLAEGIDDHYTKTLDRLKKDPIKNAKFIIKEQEMWDKLKLTRERVHDILIGQGGDTNAISAYLESYTNSPDPIIGGFAVYLKNAFNDVDAQTQRNMNEFVKEMTPLLDKAGYSRSNASKLMNQLVYAENIGYTDEKGEFQTKQVWSFLNQFKDQQVEMARMKKEYELALDKGDTVSADQALKNMRQHLRDYFHQEYTKEYYDREKIYDSELGREAYRRKHTLLNQIKELDINDYNEADFDEIAEQKKILWRQYSQLATLKDLNGNDKVGDELEIAKIEREYRKNSRDFFEWRETPGLFEHNLRMMEQSLVDDGIAPDSEEFKEARQKWIKNNTVVAYTKEFFDERNKILSRLKEIMNRIPEQYRSSVDSSLEMEQMLDMATGFRDQDGQIVGSDISDPSVEKIRGLQQTILNKKNSLAGYTGLTRNEMDELTGLFQKIAARQKLTADERGRMDDLIERKNSLGVDKFTKIEMQKLFSQLAELQAKEATDYYLDTLNNHLERMGEEIFDQDNLDDLYKPETYSKLLGQDAAFDEWFNKNHLKKSKWDFQNDREIDVYDRLFIWNKTRPTNLDHYERIELADGEVIGGKPNLSYFYRSVKDDYRTKRVVGETVDNKGNWLPKTLAQGAIDDRYSNPLYTKLQKENPAAFDVLNKLTEFHLKFQEGLPRESRLYMQIPRMRKTKLEFAQGSSVQGEVDKAKSWVKGVRDTFFSSSDDYQQGLNFNAEQLVYTDMFDEEIKKIPINGLNALDLDQVSMNIPDSMLRYMWSGIRQKKLIELNPFAQALGKVLNDPDNAIKDMTKINKGTYRATGIKAFIKKKGLSTRAKAFNNLYEREFEGVNQAGWEADNKYMKTVQKTMNGFLKVASFGYFSLNILPSAIKNRQGAIVQLSIEAAGSKWLNYNSYMRGKGLAFKIMGANMSTMYTTGTKPLEVQLAHIFDPSQQVFERALGEGEGHNLGGQFSRSLASDTASLSFFMSPRKFLELEATMEMFAGMLTHVKVKQTLNGQTKEISYADAWELRDGQIELKDGIDKSWAPGGDNFNQFKNRTHEVSNRLQGTYSRFDQPEAQRYVLFRLLSFLKRYFTSMLMNRMAVTRPSAALGTVTTGYYTSSLKVMKRMMQSKGSYYQFMSAEEKSNFVKFAADIAHQMAILFILSAFFGYDDDDKRRFAKMRNRSGNLFEDDFNVPGWLTNHGAVATLATLNETQQFSAPSQIKAMADNVLNPKAVLGAVFKKPADFLTYSVGWLTDDPSAFYKKDVGPYSFQKKKGSKAVATVANMFGFTGSQIDPVKAMKGQEFQRR